MKWMRQEAWERTTFNRGIHSYPHLFILPCFVHWYISKGTETGWAWRASLGLAWSKPLFRAESMIADCSRWVLNISKDEDSAMSLSNPFLCVTTLVLNTFFFFIYFLIYKWNFLCFCFCLLPLICLWAPLRRICLLPLLLNPVFMGMYKSPLSPLFPGWVVPALSASPHLSDAKNPYFGSLI